MGGTREPTEKQLKALKKGREAWNKKQKRKKQKNIKKPHYSKKKPD